MPEYDTWCLCAVPVGMPVPNWGQGIPNFVHSPDTSQLASRGVSWSQTFTECDVIMSWRSGIIMSSILYEDALVLDKTIWFESNLPKKQSIPCDITEWYYHFCVVSLHRMYVMCPTNSREVLPPLVCWCDLATLPAPIWKKSRYMQQFPLALLN